MHFHLVLFWEMLFLFCIPRCNRVCLDRQLLDYTDLLEDQDKNIKDRSP